MEGTSQDSGLGLLPLEGDAARRRSPETTQTDWSMIFRAADRDQPGAGPALDQVARRYWPAIFAFVRAAGRDVHEAADLTQGFVCDVVLMRQLLASADPRRGRFRTFLLSALKNYLRDQHRRETRLKRGGDGGGPLHMGQIEMAGAAVDDGQAPEQAYSSQWGATMLAQVLEQVRDACARDGLEVHWALFAERVVEPAVFGRPATSYQDLVSRHALKSPSQAANMIITVKRRVVRALLEEVRRTVEEPEAVEEELRGLLQDLEGRP